MVGDIEIGNCITKRGSVEGKNRGPRTEPRGTPYGSEKASEKLLPSLTFCFRFEREDLIHLNTVPSIPNQPPRELKRM